MNLWYNTPMVSVVVPMYNEAEVLARNAAFFRELAGRCQLIFCDGGSTDASPGLAAELGELVIGAKGRAAQMNSGAAHARENALLFLHADSVIAMESLAAVEKQVTGQRAVGGCLTQRIDLNGGIYRAIEALGNMRARVTRVFYGDQGIFVSRDAFERLCGFELVPVMEDVLFSRRLRALGATVVLPDRITVSGRRWKHQGIVKTAYSYCLMNALFWSGVPLERIARAYNDVR